MHFRPYSPADLIALTALWNRIALAGEVVYRPLNETALNDKFFKGAQGGARCFVAEDKKQIVGLIHGTVQTRYLPGETHENTPGYLTVVLVAPEYRRQNIGAALLAELEKTFIMEGKKRITVSDRNPVQLAWIVPGTPGHEHNKAPGVDEACVGFIFLQTQGYKVSASEVAMYLPLDQYIPDVQLEERRSGLLSQGIETGYYNVSLQYDFDRMCDRVGSEYWRNVLQIETTAIHPRPILAATHDGYIVGFTGPVDLEPSGRGWFTGICTDPMYEKRGIATVLFNFLMQAFITEGASYSTLFTGVENRAQHLYLRTGFRVVRRFAVMSKPL